MKKAKKFLLGLLLCPALLFCACVPPPSYIITTSPSDVLLGRITGTPTDAVVEDSVVHLSAIEYSASNPFVCWVKDYKEVFSLEQNLELLVNQETAGHYTAVYDETPQNMLFATLTSINIESSTYTNIEYDLKYSNSISGSNNYNSFSSGEFDPSTQFDTDLKSILYFGPLGNNVEYKFQITLTFTNAEATSNSQTFIFSQKLNNDTFNQTATCQLSTNLNDSSLITLNFQKLSHNLFDYSEEPTE